MEVHILDSLFRPSRSLPCEARKTANVVRHPDPGCPPPAAAASTGRHQTLCCGSVFAMSGRVQLVCSLCVIGILSRRFECTRCGTEDLAWTNWYTVAALDASVVAA